MLSVSRFNDFFDSVIFIAITHIHQLNGKHKFTDKLADIALLVQ